MDNYPCQKIKINTLVIKKDHIHLNESVSEFGSVESRKKQLMRGILFQIYNHVQVFLDMLNNQYFRCFSKQWKGKKYNKTVVNTDPNPPPPEPIIQIHSKMWQYYIMFDFLLNCQIFKSTKSFLMLNCDCFGLKKKCFSLKHCFLINPITNRQQQKRHSL